MKKIVLFVIAFLMVNVLFAGPFGLEMGMTLEEIKEKCGWNNVEHIDTDMYKIKPPRSSSSFDNYFVFVDDTFGLHSIAAWTKVMSHKECLLFLVGLNGRLKTYYGEPQKITRFKDITSVYMTFDPDTITRYDWKLPECKKLEKEKIANVFVWVSELSQDAGAVVIRYIFDNFEKVMENQSPF